jgi:hypothetical protein
MALLTLVRSNCMAKCWAAWASVCFSSWLMPSTRSSCRVMLSGLLASISRHWPPVASGMPLQEHYDMSTGPPQILPSVCLGPRAKRTFPMTIVIKAHPVRVVRTGPSPPQSIFSAMAMPKVSMKVAVGLDGRT